MTKQVVAVLGGTGLQGGGAHQCRKDIGGHAAKGGTCSPGKAIVPGSRRYRK
jgi:hypothetical protein